MELTTFFQIICAVIVANAACGAFVVGIIAATRLEKQGVHKDDLPLWVYACLISPFIVGGVGAYFLNSV